MSRPRRRKSYEPLGVVEARGPRGGVRPELPVALCDECGALVPEAEQARHDEWHAQTWDGAAPLPLREERLP